MSFAGQLIVSCQADETDAFYGLMDRFAVAAVAGGAAGIRANGVRDVKVIRAAVAVPIIGIEKQLHTDGKILITPTFEGAAALADAGANMIALDCTARGVSTGALDRLRRIKGELRVPVLADIATLEEALRAAEAGADFVLSTMRGYTAETAHIPHFEPGFIEQLVRAVRVPMIAEGRIETPEQAVQAIRAGAYAVVVGSAVTRPHVVTRRFADAVEREARPETVLGIDLGGTNIKSGLVSKHGRLLFEDTVPTPVASGRAGMLRMLAEVVRRGLSRARDLGHQPEAVGIATAGWVDPVSGRVVYATENLPGWTGTEITREIATATGMRRVSVENDANALAVGESLFGAGRGLTDFVCITLGTGVGGGCFVGGRLNRGAHFFANALGHIRIEPNGRPCNCGQAGCLETYTNAAALLGYSGGNYATNETLIAAANQGEPLALQAVRTFAARLAMGCGILVHLLDPQAIILAGGLVQNNPALIAALEVELSKLVSVWQQRELKITASTLGYHAGVLGAAAVALTSVRTGMSVR